MIDAVIYGATGYTGRLVAEALKSRGFRFAISGRDRFRLEALAKELDEETEVRLAPLHDEGALRDAISDAKVLINCAGPFSKLGEPVVAAAIECGVHYLDTTGEQLFMRDMYERYESAARKAEICVVNACAFEVALGDWAASLVSRELPGAPLDEVSISYVVDHFRTSTGTQLSMLASLEDGGCIWSHDRWEPAVLASETRLVSFPAPFGMREALSFPSGEVVTIPRHIQASRVQTFVSITDDSPVGRMVTRGASLLGPLVGALAQSPLGALARAKLSEHVSHPPLAERRLSRFALVARAERSFERRELSVSGSDPYGITAEVLALAVERLLEGDPRSLGIVTPSEAFEPESSLGAIAESCNLTVEHST